MLRYLPPQDERGRFIRACRACKTPLGPDDDGRLCWSCYCSEEYCESCGGELGDNGYEYARVCECDRAEPADPDEVPYVAARRDTDQVELVMHHHPRFGPEPTAKLTPHEALGLGIELITHAAGIMAAPKRR